MQGLHTVDDAELKVGGYTFKAQHLLFAAPIVSALAGGIYYAYDVTQRFYSVEEGVVEVQDAIGRIQALEQTIGDNDVANLSAQLSAISTNMTTILEQQKTLLDLRSKVEKAEILTDGIGARLDALQADIDSTWQAIDALERPL